MNKNLYGFMIKYPEPGRVKTRLAKDIGKEKAAEVSAQLIEKIVLGTAPSGNDFDRVIFCHPPDRVRDVASWLPADRVLPQRGNNVGERMDSAIQDLLGLGAVKAVITGADIPDLSSTIIRKAFSALDRSDIVIGPAADGGYYLIGMKSPRPEIFQGISWSTGRVREQTMGIIGNLHLTCAQITTLSDLDTAEDYRRFVMRTARGKAASSAPSDPDF